jgi:hypothetical protein
LGFAIGMRCDSLPSIQQTIEKTKSKMANRMNCIVPRLMIGRLYHVHHPRQHASKAIEAYIARWRGAPKKIFPQERYIQLISTRILQRKRSCRQIRTLKIISDRQEKERWETAYRSASSSTSSPQWPSNPKTTEPSATTTQSSHHHPAHPATSTLKPSSARTP